MADVFWLAPDALDRQASAFDEYAQQAGSAYSWLVDHPLQNTAAYPAYAAAATRAETLRASMADWFSYLQEVLAGVATELRDVAQEGRSIDTEEAAAIDASAPSVYDGQTSTATEVAEDGETPRSTDLMPVWGPPGGGAGFFCDQGPIYDHLNELTVDLVPGDLLSPSQWIDTVLGWLGATSLPERILQEFGGRWGDLRAFADTVRGMGALVDDMRGHLASAAAYIEIGWQGYAASSAKDYFEKLNGVLSDAHVAFTDAGNAFADYADGVEGTAEAVGGAAYSLLDAVLIAAVAAGLGTATIETVIGGIAGWGTAGIAMLRAGSLVKEINDSFQELNDLITILTAFDNLTSDLSDVTTQLHVPAMEATP